MFFLSLLPQFVEAGEGFVHHVRRRSGAHGGLNLPRASRVARGK
jgi:hypothetical protein